VEVRRHQNDGDMDPWQVPCDWRWQVEVRYRAAFRTERDSDLGEWAATSIGGVDDGFGSDDRPSESNSAIGSSHETDKEHVHNTHLNRRPDHGVENLDGHNAVGTGCRCSIGFNVRHVVATGTWRT
jgi:hypothetical protein